MGGVSDRGRGSDSALAVARRRIVVADCAFARGDAMMRCSRNGVEKWTVPFTKNKIVYVGLEAMLDATFATTWYVGLTAATPVIADGNTMASHVGWTEFTNYDEAVRQTYSGVRIDRAYSNALAKASFSINQNGSSIGGAFLATNSTKGGGTGTLLCCVAFTLGNKAADAGDTLDVTYNVSLADS